MAVLPLLSSLFQTAGSLQSLENQRELSIFHTKEVKKQAQVSKSLFNITFPQMAKEQVANRGMQATQFAKAGVDVGSGSPLAFLSEQARVDQLNQNLAKYQQQLDQRGFTVQKKLSKRDTSQLRTEQFFTLAGGGVSGLAGASS